MDKEINLKEKSDIPPDKVICKSYLLARYLIEDNSQDYIKVDLERREEHVRVISVFKALINKL